MGEITLFEAGKLPAHLRNVELDEITKTLIGGGGFGKRISIKGGVFRLISNGEEIAKSDDRAMSMVIVKSSSIYRTYFAGKYVEGENKAPDCWSIDTERPAPEVKNPQAVACVNCPQNIKGSGEGDSRACRFHQNLAVVLENDIGGDVYQIGIPAKSIFGKAENGKYPLQAYAQFLGANKTNVNAVVTEFRFDTDAATPKLIFKALRWVTEDEFEQAKRQGETSAANNAVEISFTQADDAEASGKADGSGDSPAIPKKAESEDKPVKGAEPVKREGKPNAKADDDINKTLDDWDKEEVA